MELDLHMQIHRCHLKSFAKTCGEESECVLNGTCQFSRYVKLSHVGWYHFYNFFGVLWSLCFIGAFGDMVLAGAFSGWYWTLDRKIDLPTFPLTSSLYRTVRYHLGTLAFGALVISIVKMIRFFLEYLDQKIKQYDQNNPLVKGIMCCCKCFFYCLEKFMRFINRNAYIMCAVYGKNFCTSARDAFMLLMRNVVRAFVLDKAADFLLFIGKLFIVGGIGLVSFYIFEQRHTHAPIEEQQSEDDEIHTLNFFLAPVIVVTIGTYFIATLFFSVYDMAVDTLFLCFLEDCERNDGSPEKPYYMPKELMGILGKKNKVMQPVSDSDRL